MSLVIFLGPPGAGKGEQSGLLREQGWSLVSMGHLLRQAASIDNERGKALKQMLAAGALVPDPWVVEMLQQGMQAPGRYVLDGFPRTLDQARAMANLQLYPSHVVVFVLPDQAIIDRLSGRLFEPVSGRVYHERHHPPKHPNVDDINGLPLIRREDDRPEVIAQRLKLYHQTMKPLMDYYRHLQFQHAFRLMYLDASYAIEDLHTTLLHAL